MLTRKGQRRRYGNRTNMTRKQDIRLHPIVKRSSSHLYVKAKLQGRTYKSSWKKYTGGATKEINMNGYTFVYDETEEHIICLPKTQKGICFKIDFDIRTASIGISIGYFPECAWNKDPPESSGTLVMLQAILQIILRHPDIHVFTHIVIDDNSHIYVRSHEDNKLYEVALMDMYFMSTGCTWYSSIVPMFLQRVSDDKQYIKDRKKVVGNEAMKWRAFLQMLPLDVRKALNDLPLDINDDDLASNVLNMIRKDRKYSIIFYKYRVDMLSAFNVSSMRGKTWVIPLQNGRIPVPESDETILGCKNEKQWNVPPQLLKHVTNDKFTAIKSSIQIPDVKENTVQYNEINVSRREYNPSKHIMNDNSGNDNGNDNDVSNISLSNMDLLLMR